IYFCQECFSAIRLQKMPRLALNNHMYRGELPDRFRDVTWMEEMAVALYRTTAHVTRLYGVLSTEQDPFQLHGNACAHPLDTVSHATSLPWSPADLNDFISVIFVGPRKLKQTELDKLPHFHVRRNVIRDLLQEFRSHNRLYMGLPINEVALSQFPENGILPGLEDRIVYD
ncbi:hypothetical protein BT96DRAFT_754775, partial [Gymnopus androsaceus JB14]